jgi:hypothetical protein
MNKLTQILLFVGPLVAGGLLGEMIGSDHATSAIAQAEKDRDAAVAIKDQALATVAEYRALYNSAITSTNTLIDAIWDSDPEVFAEVVAKTPKPEHLPLLEEGM